MATYTSIPKNVPSAQRVAEITSVVQGDRIDLTDVLGRPARRLQFVMDNIGDAVGYTVNSLLKVRKRRTREESYSTADQVWGVYGTEEESHWRTGGDAFPSISVTGSLTHETTENLSISSIEIDSLSFGGGGTSIKIIAW